MRIVSLFDGMACGYVAATVAGLRVASYDAWEIDKYAIQTAQHNLPAIHHHGDVFGADFTPYRGVTDAVIGGSPCQYWSICQKGNREVEPSGAGWDLFSQYVRAVREILPRFFIYENNKSMSKAIRDCITETFGFEPTLINSSCVSAQNRERLYWVGRRNDDGITYSKVDVWVPEDRGILLCDVLDGYTDRNKARCVTASVGRTTTREYFKKQQNTMVFEPVRVGTYPNAAKNQKHDSQQYRIYSPYGKSVTLCGNGGDMGAKTGLYAIPVELGDNNTPLMATSGADNKTYPVYEVRDGRVNIGEYSYPMIMPDGYYIIRKLTVRECMRLQTVPDWYEFPVSDTQAYKLLGNGWTVDVIVHLLLACVGER